MSDKLLVIIASSDRGKALTGLMYTRNALTKGQMLDVKLVYFGPSEKLIVEDPEVREKALELVELGESFACKAISDREKISEDMEGLGIKVEYVGSIISDYINQGYIPMVW
jgi:hypothetical protein